MLSSRILAIAVTVAIGAGVTATTEIASGAPELLATGSADGRAVTAAHEAPPGDASPRDLLRHPALAAPPDRLSRYDRLHRRSERHGLDPDRNIVRAGVTGAGGLRPATWREVEDGIAEMRREHRRAAERRVASEAGTQDPAVGEQAAGATTAPGGGLESIAACESGGDPSAVDPSGTYRGKYQFDQQTWESVGGTGDPAAAPEAEQDMRASTLMQQRGGSPWPNC